MNGKDDSSVSSAKTLRYVALGDSLSEGIGDDPWPDGTPRGWTDRFAALLAEHNDREQPIQYANLAVRGYKSTQVAETQLEAAIAMKPDVVTLTAGMNDILRPKIDFHVLQETLVRIVSPFTSAGVKLVIVPIPDVVSVSPAGRLIASRRLKLNSIYRYLSDEHGVLPITNTAGTIFEDRRAWATDRLHLSALGHERLAYAAAADVGLPVDFDFLAAPDGPVPGRTVQTELEWWGTFVAPWLGRRLTGRSSGDGRTAKRPELTPWGSGQEGVVPAGAGRA